MLQKALPMSRSVALPADRPGSQSAVVEEGAVSARCSKLFVLNVEATLRYHSSRTRTNRFIAVTAITKTN